MSDEETEDFTRVESVFNEFISRFVEHENKIKIFNLYDDYVCYSMRRVVVPVELKRFQEMLKHKFEVHRGYGGVHVLAIEKRKLLI